MIYPHTMSLAQVDLKAAAQAATRQRQANMAKRSQRTETIARIVDGIDEQQLAPLAVTAALRMMEHAATAELPEVKTSLDLERIANASRTLFTIARLARGESTSNVAHANVDPAQIEALATRLEKLRGDSP